jgi:hypothetical protein
LHRTNIRCPGECVKTNPDGKVIEFGYLIEVVPETGRLFCDTSGCKFVMLDEHKQEFWLDGEIPESVSGVKVGPKITS